MHTNHTEHYNLPQYIGTDVINPLTDTNGAYSVIDTALHNISVVADTATSDISDINAEIGTATPETEASTITGAINELKTSCDNIDGNIVTIGSDVGTLQNQMGTANDNVTSLQNNKADVTTVTALDNAKADKTTVEALDNAKADKTTVQQIDNYLDNNYTYAGLHKISVQTDGVKTNKQLMKELADACVAYFATLNNNELVRAVRADLAGTVAVPRWFSQSDNTSTHFNFLLFVLNVTNVCSIRNAMITDTEANISYTEYYLTTASNVYADLTNNTPASDRKFEVIFEVYKTSNI